MRKINITNKGTLWRHQKNFSKPKNSKTKASELSSNDHKLETMVAKGVPFGSTRDCLLGRPTEIL